MCCDCWSAERGSDVLSYRALDAPLRACCFCGKLTDAGIFVHREPKGLKCDAPAARWFHPLRSLRSLSSNLLLSMITVLFSYVAGAFAFGHEKSPWFLRASYLLCLVAGLNGGILASRADEAKREIEEKANSKIEFTRRIHLK